MLLLTRCLRDRTNNRVLANPAVVRSGNGRKGTLTHRRRHRAATSTASQGTGLALSHCRFTLKPSKLQATMIVGAAPVSTEAGSALPRGHLLKSRCWQGVHYQFATAAQTV